MNDGALDRLLDRLCSGDAAAAEQVFRAYEPYLRAVVRRRLPARLRAKFDSADVVQSAWGDVLTGLRDAGWRFADVRQLRAFLVRITHNRFIDRYRQHDRCARREEPLAPHLADALPARHTATPSAECAAADLWERLLARCPDEQRPILFLRRDGVPVDEIAARTGRHPATVRRILRQLAVQAVADPVAMADP